MAVKVALTIRLRPCMGTVDIHECCVQNTSTAPMTTYLLAPVVGGGGGVTGVFDLLVDTLNAKNINILSLLGSFVVAAVKYGRIAIKQTTTKRQTCKA